LVKQVFRILCIKITLQLSRKIYDLEVWNRRIHIFMTWSVIVIHQHLAFANLCTIFKVWSGYLNAKYKFCGYQLLFDINVLDYVYKCRFTQYKCLIISYKFGFAVDNSISFSCTNNCLKFNYFVKKLLLVLLSRFAKSYS
jgi:hypothetical protein